MNWNKTYLYVCYFITVISVGGIFYATFVFWGMLHNIDLAFNACVLFNDLNNWAYPKAQNETFDFREVTDTPTLDSEVKLVDLYVFSMNRMILLFFIVVLCAFSFGSTFSMLTGRL